jgi:Xaa-Pro aminopeptidase
MNYVSRRDRLAAELAAPGLDALLVSSPVNIRYLTGFTGGGGSYLLILRDSCLLISDGRFPAQIAEECPDVPSYIRPLGETTTEAVGRVVAKHNLRAIGFEAHSVTVAELQTLKDKVASADWVPTRQQVERLRMVKDADEIAVIRKSVAASERVFADFRQRLRAGDTEYDMTDRIEALARAHGGRATSFEPITAVGERSALAHAPPTRRRADSGAWILIDWGVMYEGYASDLTRMLIPHTPSVRSASTPPLDRAALGKVWQAVLDARQSALAVMRPGVETRAVDAAARAAIEAAGYGDRFTHSLGHGIGLEIHEGPALRSNSDARLEPGHVVTVEPGIYIPGWGGVRIEDDVLITPDGYELLSHVPRDMDAALI